MDRDVGADVVSRRSSWVRRLRTDAGTFYLKCYEYSSWGDRIQNWAKWTAPWRKSRAARECEAFAWLAERGFPAPAHFACLERRRAGFLVGATILTSAAPGFSADRLLESATPEQRTQTARAIGRFVRALHLAGFRDRNLDLRNLIVAGERIVKIDSPRHRIVPPETAEDALARADWARLLPQLAAYGVAEDAAGAGSDGAASLGPRD